MDDQFPWLLIPVLIFAGIMLTYRFAFWLIPRSRIMLERWVTDNGYRLLFSELRWLRRGPFLWTLIIWDANTVYFVIVQTPEGEIRRGWLRCGGFFWKMWRYKTEVRWEV